MLTSEFKAGTWSNGGHHELLVIFLLPFQIIETKTFPPATFFQTHHASKGILISAHFTDDCHFEELYRIWIVSERKTFQAPWCLL